MYLVRGPLATRISLKLHWFHLYKFVYKTIKTKQKHAISKLFSVLVNSNTSSETPVAVSTAVVITGITSWVLSRARHYYKPIRVGRFNTGTEKNVITLTKCMPLNAPKAVIMTNSLNQWRNFYQNDNISISVSLKWHSRKPSMISCGQSWQWSISKVNGTILPIAPIKVVTLRHSAWDMSVEAMFQV